jgi:3-oxoadipate enol-lactonase
MWDDEVKRLAKSFTVLTYDIRGHGESGAPAMPYTLDMIADDVKGLYDHLGIERSHWIGLSMGGVFGLAAALRYPGIFETMVLADTSSRLSDDGIAAFKDRVATVRAGGMEAMVEPTLKRWFKDSFRAKSPELMARVADWIRTTPLEGYIGCSAAIPTIDVTHRLGEIDIPCLVIVGADDIAMPPVMAQTLARNLPDAELCVIPDAGHLSNLEQPEAFNAALQRFLGLPSAH